MCLLILPPEAYPPVLSGNKGNILVSTCLAPVSSLDLVCPWLIAPGLLLWTRLSLGPQITQQWPGDRRACETLTQARGLLSLHLGELGDGVGPVAVSEDDAQLLADHFVLWKRQTSSPAGGCAGSQPSAARDCVPQPHPTPRQHERSPQRDHGFQQKWPWPSRVRFALAGPGGA